MRAAGGARASGGGGCAPTGQSGRLKGRQPHLPALRLSAYRHGADYALLRFLLDGGDAVAPTLVRLKRCVHLLCLFYVRGHLEDVFGARRAVGQAERAGFAVPRAPYADLHAALLRRGSHGGQP